MTFSVTFNVTLSAHVSEMAPNIPFICLQRPLVDNSEVHVASVAGPTAVYLQDYDGYQTSALILELMNGFYSNCPSPQVTQEIKREYRGRGSEMYHPSGLSGSCAISKGVGTEQCSALVDFQLAL
jgi:hypothetical protein